MLVMRDWRVFKQGFDDDADSSSSCTVKDRLGWHLVQVSLMMERQQRMLGWERQQVVLEKRREPARDQGMVQLPEGVLGQVLVPVLERALGQGQVLEPVGRLLLRRESM